MIEVRTIAYSEMGLFDEQLSNLLNEGWQEIKKAYRYQQ